MEDHERALVFSCYKTSEEIRNKDLIKGTSDSTGGAGGGFNGGGEASEHSFLCMATTAAGGTADGFSSFSFVLDLLPGGGGGRGRDPADKLPQTS